MLCFLYIPENFSVGLRQLESDNSKLSKKGQRVCIYKGGSSWRANKHSVLMWDGLLLYSMVVMFLATEGLVKPLQTVNTKEARVYTPEYKSEETWTAAHS